MSERIAKINDLIRDNLAEILTKDIAFKKGVFVSLVKVSTTQDLERSQILVSVFPETERGYVMATLQKELYRIQGALNRKMQLRRLPRIEFIVDTTQEKVEELEKLFDQIKQEK